MGIALVGENGGAMGARLGINKIAGGNTIKVKYNTNGEHMVAGSEENKR